MTRKPRKRSGAFAQKRTDNPPAKQWRPQVFPMCFANLGNLGQPLKYIKIFYSNLYGISFVLYYIILRTNFIHMILCLVVLLVVSFGDIYIYSLCIIFLYFGILYLYTILSYQYL